MVVVRKVVARCRKGGNAKRVLCLPETLGSFGSGKDAKCSRCSTTSKSRAIVSMNTAVSNVASHCLRFDDSKI